MLMEISSERCLLSTPAALAVVTAEEFDCLNDALCSCVAGSKRGVLRFWLNEAMTPLLVRAFNQHMSAAASMTGYIRQCQKHTGYIY